MKHETEYQRVMRKVSACDWKINVIFDILGYYSEVDRVGYCINNSKIQHYDGHLRKGKRLFIWVWFFFIQSTITIELTTNEHR